MNITFAQGEFGLQRGDIITALGERYVVTNVINGHALTIRDFSWWDRFKHCELFRVFFWRPLRAWRWSDWMPDSYYKQKEWDEWEQKALEAIKND